MLYWITQFFQGEYHALRVFQYLTFRSILAALTAFIVALVCGPLMIKWLKGMQIGQTVRDDGPETHLSKTGTPTMGGVLILFSITVSCLLWGHLTQPNLWLALFVTLGFGLIGWVDDYRKLVLKKYQRFVSEKKIILAVYYCAQCRNLFIYAGCLSYSYAINDSILKRLLGAIRHSFSDFGLFCHRGQQQCSEFNGWIGWFSNHANSDGCRCTRCICLCVRECYSC